MTPEELSQKLTEVGLDDDQVQKAIENPEIAERWLLKAEELEGTVRSPAAYVWKGVLSGLPPKQPHWKREEGDLHGKARAWKQGDGPKPKLPPEVSPESFFAIADAHLSSYASAFYMDYDDPAVEAAHPDLWKKGGVFIKSQAVKELTYLERKYRQTFSDEDRERLMKRAEQYAKEAMQQEREEAAKGRAFTRHRRLELMKEGKDPNRFWGGATEEELEIWNRRGEVV